MPFIKNDNKYNRRVFIKNIFTGSFGLALGVVVGCSDNSASNISKDTKSNTQSPDSATQPLQKTSQPTVVKPSQPTVV